MKNVLLLVHDDTGLEARVQAALDLTRAVDGHLSCLCVVELPALPGVGAMAADAEQVMLAEAKDRAAGIRETLTERLAREDVAWDWHDVCGSIGFALRDNAGLADIIVVNTMLGDGLYPDMRALASELALRSGTLVLAVPDHIRGFNATGRALVAWNGSFPVEETLRRAAPLLARASGVVLLQVGASKEAPPEDAAAYLSRHGIHAEIEHLPREGPVVDTLIDAMRRGRFGYVVIGAYGHSPMREAILGGVTRQLLNDCPLPLLLGH
ncbi:MAG: universal stress protein UspA [Sphingobium sp.]|nr:MAG: universal stress protein UspA [Sphingobium sp.]